MRRSVIGTEAVTGIVRVIGDTDIIAPITDPTMATTVIADPTTVMAMAIGRLASRYQLVVWLQDDGTDLFNRSNKDLWRRGALLPDLAQRLCRSQPEAADVTRSEYSLGSGGINA